MMNNTRLIKALPNEDQRLRNAIVEIEKFLAVPSSPMDCDIIINQMSQMTMSSNDNDIIQEKVHLEKPVKDSTKITTNNNKFSDECLNEVKQRLKTRQAECDNELGRNKVEIVSDHESDEVDYPDGDD